MEQTPLAISNAPVIKPKTVYTAQDRLLLAITLVLCILVDRLLFDWALEFAGYGILGICILIAGMAWCFKTAKSNAMSWVAALLSLTLCIWNICFDQATIRMVNMLVIPLLIMFTAIFATNRYAPKEIAILLFNWLVGWVYKPFNRIGRMFGAIGSMFHSAGSKTMRNVLLGLLFSLPLIAVILPFLFSADAVFSYYGAEFFARLNIFEIILHATLVFASMLFVYSFCYNLKNAPKRMELKPITLRWNVTVVSVALGVLLAVYALFTGVQVTYLFGGAGLPEGMTYAEYARSGFFELLGVAAINISAFGLCLRFTEGHKAITGMLCALLLATGVMIASSLMRLFMYIGAYQLTELRVFALWFLIFLCAAVMLCAARVFLRKLPLMRVCAVLLCVWYIALAFANIDNIIAVYNSSGVL